MPYALPGFMKYSIGTSGGKECRVHYFGFVLQGETKLIKLHIPYTNNRKPAHIKKIIHITVEVT